MAQTMNIGNVTVETHVIGPIETNVYIISAGDSVIVVDPADDCARILAAVGDRTVAAIVITHGHFDHTGAAAELREATGAPVYASAADTPLIEKPMRSASLPITSNPCTVDHQVNEGDRITIAGLTWDIMITPGHTPGCTCWFLSADQTGEDAAILVSGDTLFAGACGRTDFENGSMDDMRASLARLAKLPDATLVLPGHMGMTSIIRERHATFARFGIS